MDGISLFSLTEICLEPLSGGIKPMGALGRSTAVCRRGVRWFYTCNNEQGTKAFLTHYCVGFLCNAHSRDTRPFFFLMLLYYGS